MLQDDADKSKVSSFYGPGTYTAWYLTALSVTAFGVNSATIIALPSTTIWFTPDTPATSGDILDVEFLLIILYPLLSSLDILLRCLFQQNPDAASIAAAGHVVAAAAQFACLLAIHTSDLNDRRAPQRHVVYVATWIISMIALSVSVTQLPDTFTIVMVGLGAFVGVMLAIMDVTFDVPINTLGRNIKSAIMMFRDFMLFVMVPKYFVPQSMSHIWDWNQLAFVVVAVVILLIRYLKSRSLGV